METPVVNPDVGGEVSRTADQRIQELERRLAQLSLEKDRVPARGGDRTPKTASPGEPLPPFASPQKVVRPPAANDRRAALLAELDALEAEEAANDQAAAGIMLPLVDIDGGREGRFGPNRFWRPPTGVEYDTPRLFDLYGYKGFDLMEKRDQQFSANEMKHLAPFGFYLHNLCLVMEACEIMGVDNEGKAVEVRESILAYLQALLTLVCTRHDFLVANAVMSKTNPGLIAYLRITQEGKLGGTQMAGSTITELADRYMEQTVNELAKRGAKGDLPVWKPGTPKNPSTTTSSPVGKKSRKYRKASAEAMDEKGTGAASGARAPQ